jgi:hypothetical protein
VGAVRFAEGPGNLGLERACVGDRREQGSDPGAERVEPDEQSGSRRAGVDGASRMRPEIPNVFEVFAADLMSRVMPEVTPIYHQGTISMVAIMFVIAGERWDTAASWRVEENDSLREIFRDSIDVIADRDLKERLTKLSETRDDDLRIAALTASNSAMRAAVIELHRHVESIQNRDARRIEAAIWRELSKSTERRRISTAPF